MATASTALADIITPTRRIVESIVWCTVSTVDPSGQAPRSRVMHPVWFWRGGPPFALVTARPTPIKIRHLSPRPAVACSYWDPAYHTVVVDAHARWLEPAEIGPAWDAIRSVPEPVGFDPAIVWPEGPGSDGCAILRFDAHRIVTTPAGQPGMRWTGR